MKKSLVYLFSVLLLGSVCFAEEASVTPSNIQEKLAEVKKQDNKKSVKPMIKKSSKKVKKVDEPVKK
ncbi:MAG: hypothetical protein WC738_05400 [Candidatus Omnitrophota bacterium]|jgi:hypothetical protein